jgi:hypothetical protein
MGLRLSLARAHGAALGPRTTGKPWTTAANDGQPTVLVSSRFGAFAQVIRSPGLSRTEEVAGARRRLRRDQPRRDGTLDADLAAATGDVQGPPGSARRSLKKTDAV